MNIAPLDGSAPIVEEDDTMTQRTRTFMNQVARLGILEDSGTPEGVVEALPTVLYMDTVGTAGNILYIKRDADIAGDKTMGWILV